MLRRIVILMWILTGGWCLLGLADSREWMRPVWERLLPESILPRQRSVIETQLALVERRMSEIDHNLASITVARNELSHRRHDLLVRLRKQIGGESGEKSVRAKRVAMDNPIVAALVKSIAAEDQRDAEMAAMRTELRLLRDRMEARLISLHTGASLIDLSELAYKPNPSPSRYPNEANDRYERILHEAMSPPTQ